MAENINRKKFLRLSLLAPLGWMISESAAKAIAVFSKGPVNNQHVAFYKSGDPLYESLRKGFNKRIDKLPAVIALCQDTTGVSEAVKYAIANNLPVAVKSGGHCMEGFSSNNNGMVINLSAMKKIEWLSSDTIRVNPGCTLTELYNELLPKKRIIPGGSCAGVGIGGLVLGGGYGLMARRFGLTCDSLQGITIVDGKGNITSVSGEDELLWACRGGNNGNFGVVTELVFKTHKAPATMQSFRFKSFKVTTEKARLILEKWFMVAETLPNNCFSAFVQNGKTTYILLTNTGSFEEKVKAAITELKSVTEKFTQTKPQPIAAALKVYYGQTSPLYFKNASAGLYKKFSDISNFVDKALDIVLSTPGMIYQVNTLGGKITDAVFEKNASFPHRAYPFFSELQTYWENPVQEKKLLEKFQLVQDVFNSNGIKAQYRNYPDIQFSNWPELYYGSNYARLQEIKTKYDPDNLFRYEQSIRIK